MRRNNQALVECVCSAVMMSLRPGGRQMQPTPAPMPLSNLKIRWLVGLTFTLDDLGTPRVESATRGRVDQARGLAAGDVAVAGGVRGVRVGEGGE